MNKRTRTCYIQRNTNYCTVSAPIHIRTDTQEHRSGIPILLAAMPQAHIEVIPLRRGDEY